MTQQEKFLALMNEFGVTVKEEKEKTETGEQTQLTLEASDEEDGKVVGYSGFYTTFFFDKDGNFIRMGIWE